MRCVACGNERITPSERRIQVDRGEVFEQPVRAVQCEACGYLCADDEERARALRVNREVEPPTRR